MKAPIQFRAGGLTFLVCFLLELLHSSESSTLTGASENCNNATWVQEKLCPEDFSFKGADDPFVCRCSVLNYFAVCEDGFMDSVSPSNCDLEFGAWNTTACCPGYFCPGKASCMAECPKGGYCPGPLTEENAKGDVQCVMGSPKAGLGCPGGVASPLDRLCPAGHFCPNTKTREICPEGSFCPEGVTEPIKCRVTEKCPRGSERPQAFYLPLLLAFFSSPLLFILFLGHRAFKKHGGASKGVFRKMAYGVACLLLVPIGILILLFKALRSFFMKLYFLVWETIFPILTAPASANSLYEDPITLVVCRFTVSKIFKDISFQLEAGRLCAIMGSSGAGKSTLSDWISYRSPRSVRRKENYANGKFGSPSGVFISTGTGNKEMFDLYKHHSRLYALIGLAPQFEIIYHNLKVVEYLRYQGLMRNPKYSDELLDKWLKRFKMREKRNDLISILSGGQKKRVNVLAEIIGGARILLLDEATSGLDSDTTQVIMAALREYAKEEGAIIMVVIHQPSQDVFDQFGDVLYLDTGRGKGRVAYFGERDQAIRYFYLNALGDGLHGERQHLGDLDTAMDIWSVEGLMRLTEILHREELPSTSQWDRFEAVEAFKYHVEQLVSGDMRDEKKVPRERKLQEAVRWILEKGWDSKGLSDEAALVSRLLEKMKTMNSADTIMGLLKERQKAFDDLVKSRPDTDDPENLTKILYSGHWREIVSHPVFMVSKETPRWHKRTNESPS
uniref:ABC transporter domain-containing protein n=1 Tax=Chromera velia CCMP2878 TaxID=1169474 RepID=A0A0G4GNG6_9ALVE|eukprot:Cvel_22684.t1-p1 / transcript=Cvel_22684.t1 / gene=Cvel_22684 / organism=Chromera_velia_CCMP2878 / gene_product=ABC transporter G family member 1, putative / transcript_product=ABC transporter G family member 1, putative / location=Cvel_scaffold2257:17160-21431(+) / protein_length=729 / sequence_SO=supercontig / SO=protein_coding / is_pseudo=false